MNQPKRIVIVTDYAWVIGGASKVAIHSAAALARRGYDTHHFSAVGPVARELSESPVRVHCLEELATLEQPSRFVAAQKGLWNRAANHAFADFLTDFSPEDTLIHVHQWTKALSPSIFTPVIKRGFRFVVTLHDYFACCPNGGFLVYPSSEVCRHRPLSLSCVACDCDPRNYVHKMWRVVRQVMQNQLLLSQPGLSNVIYVSEFSRRILQPHLPPSLNWFFVPNPIQAEQAPRVDVTANQAFVFVGRLSKEKGGDLFAQAAKQAGVPAVFVGDGEQRERILQLNPAAEITGWLAPEEVYARLAQARALVFPSIWYEMQGLTVAEAASMGVPSIVGDRSAAREFVRDGVNGLYMQGASVDDLARKLSMLRDDPTLERMSVSAYDDFWRQPPDLDRHLAHLEDAYRAVFANAVA